MLWGGGFAGVSFVVLGSGWGVEVRGWWEGEVTLEDRR